MKYSCYSSLKAFHWSRRACFLSLSLIPQYFTLKNGHYLNSNNKKWVRKMQNVCLFLLCSRSLLLAGTGRETHETFFDQSHAPVLYIRKKQLNGTCCTLLFVCLFNLLYIFRLKSIFNFSCNALVQLTAKRFQFCMFMMFNDFSLKFSWKF